MRNLLMPGSVHLAAQDAHQRACVGNNETGLVWITLTGPAQIEIVARTLAAEHQGT
ncbi:MAG TPA: hypothetical protein VF070_30820 [Streptosporangiaceae bacterium]